MHKSDPIIEWVSRVFHNITKLHDVKFEVGSRVTLRQAENCVEIGTK